MKKITVILLCMAMLLSGCAWSVTFTHSRCC